MAKVKQMAWDDAEKQVDDILDKYKDNVEVAE